MKELKERFNDTVSIAVSKLRNSSGHMYVLLAAYSDIAENNDVETACTKYLPYSRLMKIEINPDFPKNQDELRKVLVHEVLHNILGHFVRLEVIKASKRNKMVTNVILDCQVNEIADEILGTKVLADGCYFEKIEEIAKEKNIKWRYNKNNLYDPIERWIEELEWLYEMSDSNCNCISDMDNHNHNYEESDSDMDRTKLEAAAKSLEGMCQEVQVRAAKSGYSEKGGLFERIIVWQGKTRKVISVPAIMNGINCLNKKTDLSTYTKNNFFQNAYNYRKKVFLEKPSPKVVFAVDVSGSLGEEELPFLLKAGAKINAETDLIFWSCDEIDPENIHKNISLNKLKNITPKSNGGTEILPLYRYIEENYDDVLLVIATDLYYDKEIEHIPQNVKGMLIMHTREPSEEYLQWSKATKARFFKQQKIIMEV
jgi:predicted metal-dependent peptidase